MNTPADQPRASTSSEPFIWPPTPVPTDAAARSAGPDRSSTPTPPPRSTADARPRRRLAHLLADAERFWLVPTALPLPRRLEQTGWSPTPPEASCERCGEPLGPYEGDEFGCPACRGRRLPWERFVRLALYEPPLSTWIGEVKFGANRRLGVELGRLLGARLAACGAATVGERWVVAPIPSSWARRVQRGVDHAAAVGEGVAERLGAARTRPLRARWRPSQRSVAVSRRRANVSGAFLRRRGVSLAGSTLVLVDDVRTTGATLRAACRTLRAGPDRPRAIWAATLAVAPDPARNSGETGGGSEAWKNSPHEFSTA